MYNVSTEEVNRVVHHIKVQVSLLWYIVKQHLSLARVYLHGGEAGRMLAFILVIDEALLLIAAS